MNKINTDKLLQMLNEVQEDLNLSEDYIPYMLDRVKKSTEGRDKVLFCTYDYLTGRNMDELQALKCIFRRYGNTSLLQKFMHCEKYRDVFQELINDNQLTEDNISEKYFNSVSYYTILVHFLKGRLNKCVVCGKWTLNTCCSIACSKVLNNKG